MALNKQTSTGSQALRVFRSDGKSAVVTLKPELYSLAVKMLGTDGVSETAKQEFLQFNGGLGGHGASKFVSEKLSTAMTLTVARVTAPWRSLLGLSQSLAIAPQPVELSAGFPVGPSIDLDAPWIQTMTEPKEIVRQTYCGYTISWEVMPWSMFSALPPSPYQRHTEGRAESANDTHLKHESPMHVQVAATRLAGKLNMLDAHTRSFLQRRNLLSPPKALLCMVVHCKSKADLKAFYDQVDNVQAAELAKQKVYGTWRSLGFTPQTPFMTSKAKSALQLGVHGVAATKDARTVAEAALMYVKPLDKAGRGLSDKARPATVGAAITAVKRLYECGQPEDIALVSEFLTLFENLDVELIKKRTAARSKGRSFVVPEELRSAPEQLACFFCTSSTMTGLKGQEKAYRMALSALHSWLASPARVYAPDELVEMSMQEFLAAKLQPVDFSVPQSYSNSALDAPPTVQYTNTMTDEEGEAWMAALLGTGPTHEPKSAMQLM